MTNSTICPQFSNLKFQSNGPVKVKQYGASGSAKEIYVFRLGKRTAAADSVPSDGGDKIEESHEVPGYQTQLVWDSYRATRTGRSSLGMPFSLRKEPDPDQAALNRRSRGRVRPEGLECNFGTILDLSGSGMRILTNHSVEGVLPIEMLGTENPIKFDAEVVWIRKVGFRKYQMGLRFVDMPPSMSRSLAVLATTHRKRMSF